MWVLTAGGGQACACGAPKGPVVGAGQAPCTHPPEFTVGMKRRSSKNQMGSAWVNRCRLSHTCGSAIERRFSLPGTPLKLM